MAQVSLVGSRVLTPNAQTPRVMGAPGTGGGDVHVWVETVETTASDSVSSTYHLASLPSNARILGLSKFAWDDLATTGSPTLDLGVFNQTGDTGITDDPDALSAGHAVSSAGSGDVVGVIEHKGLPLWDFVASQTTDPGTTLDIKATLEDAALTAAGAGTLMIEIYYTLD